MGENSRGDHKLRLPFLKVNCYWTIVALHTVLLVSAVSKVHQLSIYVYPLVFWISFPCRSPPSTEFPVLHHMLSLVIYLIQGVESVYVSVPISQSIPPSLPSLGVHMLVFSVCVSISTLQTKTTYIKHGVMESNPKKSIGGIIFPVPAPLSPESLLLTVQLSENLQIIRIILVGLFMGLPRSFETFKSQLIWTLYQTQLLSV